MVQNYNLSSIAHHRNINIKPALKKQYVLDTSALLPQEGQAMLNEALSKMREFDEDSQRGQPISYAHENQLLKEYMERDRLNKIQDLYNDQDDDRRSKKSARKSAANDDDGDDDNDDDNMSNAVDSDEGEEVKDKNFFIYSYFMREEQWPVLKYCRDRHTQPLWYCERGTWKQQEAGRCSNCASALVFELQLNSTLLNLYSELVDFDWGIIVCYTCENSCAYDESRAYVEERVLIQFDDSELVRNELIAAARKQKDEEGTCDDKAKVVQEEEEEEEQKEQDHDQKQQQQSKSSKRKERRNRQKNKKKSAIQAHNNNVQDQKESEDDW